MTPPAARRAGWRRGVLIPLLLGLTAAFAAPGAGQAEEATSWKVKNRLQGKIKNGKAEKAEDVSGIACMPGAAFPRLCLAVDDETQGAQVVILQQGGLVAGDFIPLIEDSFEGKALELDAEGVAYADGFFYVAGSQGRPRQEDAAKQPLYDAKAAATRKVFRIALGADAVDLETGALARQPEVATSAGLAAALQADPAVAPFFDRPLERNGLTVEGIAVAGGNLYAGLRGPVTEDGKALIARLPLATVFDGAPGAATLFRLALGNDSLGDPRGIRDLVADGDGFLLIAGPENDPPKKHAIEAGDYAIFSWKDGAPNEDGAAKLLDLRSYGKKVKPEALLPLGRDAAALHALLLFDGPKEGMPTPVDVPLR